MRKISTRFAVLLAVAAIVPLLAYGGASIYSLEKGTRESVITGNLNVAKRAAEEIERYISSHADILKALAADLQDTELQPWQQDRILKNYVLQFPEFREITLFDPADQPMASSRLGIPSARFADGTIQLAGVALSPITLDEDLLPTLVFTVPLTRLGRPVGKLAGIFSLEEMWRTVDRIRIGTRGFASVVTADGQLLAHGDPDQKPRVARGDKLLDRPLVQAIRTQAEPWAQSLEYIQSDGPTMVTVAAPIPSLRWVLMVEQPKAEAYFVAHRLARQLMVAIAVALLLMVSVGYLWGRRFFIRPIFALMHGTKALAAGRLEERVAIATGDEFEQLGDAFNTMAGQLVKLQEDVRRQERHAMFGRIASGLVHDLSHPIQNIGNSCKLLVRMFDDLEYRRSFQRTIEREFGTLKRILEDLRNVARPVPLERFPIDVNRSVLDAVESMRLNAENGGVVLETELTEEPVQIEGDGFALGRVYGNLVLNAIQATPPGGRVCVGTARNEEQVRVTIADTGCGIPVERLSGIFDDFVTTKRRGLGLGLAISKKIVEQLGGTITVTSQVGRGTTFVLQFPANDERPARVAAAG